MDMPWLVLGVVLGLLLVLLAGLATAAVLRRRAARPRDGGPAALGEDDLPGFLESPPGSVAAAAPEGWAVLAAPAAAPPAPPERSRRDTLVVLAVMAVTALLLLAVAAAVVAGSRSDGRRGHTERTGPADAVEARLTFGGVVLEPRAVGVTATYPVVGITADGGRSSARVQFPTFNCLTAEAPDDPVAAGCTPSVTEYAELHSPELAVDTAGDGVRISGRFPTELRPNGSAPTPTGRAYDLRITVTPTDGSGRGWRPADGVLELGSDRAVTTEGEIRSGS